MHTVQYMNVHTYMYVHMWCTHVVQVCILYYSAIKHVPCILYIICIVKFHVQYSMHTTCTGVLHMCSTCGTTRVLYTHVNDMCKKIGIFLKIYDWDTYYYYDIYLYYLRTI